MTKDREAAQALCEAVACRIENDRPDLTGRIRAELPSYARIADAEHRRTVHELARRVLTSLATGAGPVAEHLQYTRRAAMRRAQLGVSAYEVLRSFQIVSRGLWCALQGAPEATESLLIELVDPLAGWTEAMTSTVIDAFVDESPTTHAREAAIRRQFFADLGDAGCSERTAETARTLAFDVSGDFQAICASRSLWPEPEVERLQRATRRLTGVVHCGVRGTALTILTQDSDISAALRAAQAISGEHVRYGVGLARSGLTGAHSSCIDAERALHIAEMWRRPSSYFADCWLEASLVDGHDKLAPLFDGVQRTATAHPDLADAVLTFADCGFSLARAAQRLHVHPNSVSYRLSRWHALTGVDPRTFAGLVRSAVGCRMARTDQQR
ncbi:PucR family transcriptional regulator [Nocardia canadensis]|uniref:PucR family transcriptional regulator n=1 Tax=Nocardia canadensis TaxID=3065238 RepID=UPI00292CD694|nr:helix-turn-helix domain-containing protein [Nocardia canadensis]